LGIMIDDRETDYLGKVEKIYTVIGHKITTLKNISDKKSIGNL
jgi:hypothetical protein